jgi:hypothetical protein
MPNWGAGRAEDDLSGTFAGIALSAFTPVLSVDVISSIHPRAHYEGSLSSLPLVAF